MVPRSRRCVSAASRTPTPDIQALISVRLPLIEPGQAPDVTHLAERQVEHMLRKEIQHSDRSFYRGKTRVELQQEACRELNRLPLSFLRVSEVTRIGWRLARLARHPRRCHRKRAGEATAKPCECNCRRLALLDAVHGRCGALVKP